METIIFGQWWRSHQSLAREVLRIFRFCVMPWKDEREPTVKLCMGRQVDVVQKFIAIQSFGHNWWWANGIRVEYFLRINQIAAEPRVKLYMPRAESFPIPLKYIDVSRTTHTSLDVMLEKHIEDCWNVDGERELSDAWTGFTRFILLNERPPEG